MKKEWFDVDPKGLRNLLNRRGKSFAIYELLQNALDTDATEITIYACKNGRDVELSVKDNSSTGFVDLSHAFTLFAPSTKLEDPEKRGRFNLGEKLVLSLCKRAHIRTMTGTVTFKSDGTRSVFRAGIERGTVFDATLPMTVYEFAEFERGIRRCLIPVDMVVTYNGQVLQWRTPLTRFNVTLPTVGRNSEGEMIRTRRKTVVHVHENWSGETSALFEMGIPVVEIEDRFSIDIQQKVPQALSRDNVPASYLQLIRTHVLNATAALLSKDEANNTWVRDAIDHKDIEKIALDTVMRKRFGEKRAVYDPSDPEANSLAVSKGYTIIPGGALSKETWENVKAHESARPAGQLTPSPKPFTDGGKPLKLAVDSEQFATWRTWFYRLTERLMGFRCRVTIANDPQWKFSAAYGAKHLTINVARLGYAWFESPTATMVDLMLHELAHEYASDHLSHEYHAAITDLAGKLVMLVAGDPSLMRYGHYDIEGFELTKADLDFLKGGEIDPLDEDDDARK